MGSEMCIRDSCRRVAVWPVRPAAVCGGWLLRGAGTDGIAEVGNGEGYEAAVELGAVVGAGVVGYEAAVERGAVVGAGVVTAGAQLAARQAIALKTIRTRSPLSNDPAARNQVVFMLGLPHVGCRPERCSLAEMHSTDAGGPHSVISVAPHDDHIVARGRRIIRVNTPPGSSGQRYAPVTLVGAVTLFAGSLTLVMSNRIS